MSRCIGKSLLLWFWLSLPPTPILSFGYSRRISLRFFRNVILGVIGLPLEGLGLLLVTDRILDMIRTAVNVFSDACGALVIAKSEGDKTAVDQD